MKNLLQLVLQPGQSPRHIGTAQNVDIFFREVEGRLDQHTQRSQRGQQRAYLRRERARQRPAGAARCGLCAGVYQVCCSLGLRQVHLVIEKRTLGELARLRHTQTDQRTSLQTARQQHLQHNTATVRLQFQHVFTGVGVW